MRKNNNHTLRIMSQNKNFITSLGRECWISSCVNKGVPEYRIMHNGYIDPCLGMYYSYKRAEEILNKIFECIKNNKESYEMPLE
ncbi:hypothetical protein [Anaerosporobacter sp.]